MIEFIHVVFGQENKNYWFFSYEKVLKMNTEDFENLTFNTFDKENTLLYDSFDPDSNFSIRMVLIILLTSHLKL